MFDIEESLRKCGKKVFVKYFIYFILDDDKKTTEQRLINDSYKESSAKNNTTQIKSIIDNALVKEALENIADSPKVEQPYQKQAKNLLQALYGDKK